MFRRALGLLLSVLFLAAGWVAADSRIVEQTHQDPFTVMGQSHAAQDQEQVLWVGSDRMRMDQGDASTVVRLDLGKMFVIDHAAKTVSTLDLPIDLKALMPPGMAEQMLKMMAFQVEVTPRDETRTVGSWEAHRYDVVMSSPMMTVKATYWASPDVDLDMDQFYKLYQKVMSLQPGMAEVAEKLRSIDGFVVAQEAVATMPMMGDVTMKTTQNVVSVDQQDAPAGTYEPLAGYADKPFNFTEMMQKRQQR